MATALKAQKTLPTGITLTKAGRYSFNLKRVLPDGQVWRKASEYNELKDAVAARAKALKEFEGVQSGAQALVDGSLTVGEWCDHFLTTIMPTGTNRRGKAYSANTQRQYRQIISANIKPNLGSVRLDRLSVDHVDALIGALTGEANKINTKNTLSRILEIAEQRGKRQKGSNPCHAVTVARTKTKRTKAGDTLKTKVANGETGAKLRYTVTESAIPAGTAIESKRVLTHDEESTLLATAKRHRIDGDRLVALILLGTRAGLRIAESIGLDWRHVNFETGMITVEQQAQRVIGEGHQIFDTKSGAGNRVIPMSAELREALLILKAQAKTDHVIETVRAKNRLDAARASEKLRTLCDLAGLGDKIVDGKLQPRPTFHDLRRTCLTRLANGTTVKGERHTPVPANILIRISGHEDVTTLLSYYTTSNYDDVREAMTHMP